VRTESSPNGDGVPEPGDALAFHVHNPGEIPPAVAARIFQRSFTTRPARTRPGHYSMKLLGERYLGGKSASPPAQNRHRVLDPPACPKRSAGI